MPNYVTNNLKIQATASQLDEILEAIRFEDGAKGTIDFNRLIPMPASLDLTQGSITNSSTDAFISNLQREFFSHKASSGIPLEEQNTILLYTNAYQALHHKGFSIPNGNMSEEEIEAQANRHEMSVEAFLALGKQYLDNIIEHGAATWYDWRINNWGTKWNLNPEDCIQANENTLSFDTAWSAPYPILDQISQMFPDVVLHHEWADEDLGYNVGCASYQNGEVIKEYVPKPGSKEAYDLAFRINGTTAADHCLAYDENEGTYVYSEELAMQEREAFEKARSLAGQLEDAQQRAAEQDSGKVDLGREPTR